MDRESLEDVGGRRQVKEDEGVLGVVWEDVE